ncbi:hypothetical protein BDZ97DRAFT_1926834 [Flammula alnicola]|nr:hypothetical protein BDZ97DRAFT_1926834 [Flammula alnicola]
MFSRLNHHHQRQRGGSEPPALGSRRPRPAESTPSASEPDTEAQEGEEKVRLTLHTKSPHTRRVVKRGRTSNRPDSRDDAEALFLASPPSPTPFRLQRGSIHVEAQPSTQPTPTTSTDVAARQVERLESLLDSVLATLSIIQANSTTPVALSAHSREALAVLNKIVTPEAPPVTNKPTTTSKSYAQATKDCHATQTVAHAAKPSHAGRLTHTRSRPGSSPATHHSPHRLIVRWPDHPVPQSSSSLQKFITQLKNQLPSDDVHISGANVTKAGSIVIHTKAPYKASQLLENLPSGFMPIRRAATAAIPDFSPPLNADLNVELDVPWYGIVVHDIPAMPLAAAFKGEEGGGNDLWDALEGEAGLAGQDIKDLRLLCRIEEMDEREHMSVKIMLEDSRICQHLKRNGVFLFGTHCRVSEYRRRKKHPPPPSRPTSP